MSSKVFLLNQMHPSFYMHHFLFPVMLMHYQHLIEDNVIQHLESGRLQNVCEAPGLATVAFD